jgi:hypothetical protein
MRRVAATQCGREDMSLARCQPIDRGQNIPGKLTLDVRRDGAPPAVQDPLCPLRRTHAFPLPSLVKACCCNKYSLQPGSRGRSGRLCYRALSHHVRGAARCVRVPDGLDAAPMLRPPASMSRGTLMLGMCCRSKSPTNPLALDRDFEAIMITLPSVPTGEACRGLRKAPFKFFSLRRLITCGSYYMPQGAWMSWDGAGKGRGDFEKRRGGGGGRKTSING